MIVLPVEKIGKIKMKKSKSKIESCTRPPTIPAGPPLAENWKLETGNWKLTFGIRPNDVIERGNGGIKKIFYFDTLSSTNDAALAYARREPDPEDTLFWAARQTEGRGRMGREWISPPGGLWFSVIAKVSEKELHAVSMMASLSVIRFLSSALGITGLIKWPNDILVSGKKIAGVLIELVRSKNDAYVVARLGINCRLKESDMPKALEGLWTDIAKEYGRGTIPNNRDLLFLWCQSWEELSQKYWSGKSFEICEEWKARLMPLSGEITVCLQGRSYKGAALGWTHDGGLKMKNKNGEKIFYAGDVFAASNP